MGWLYYHRPRGESDFDHFAAKFSEPYRLLASATKSNVFYGAVEDTRTGHIEGFVALIRRARGEMNFGYKDMGETAGPYATECPARILDMLTPVEECYGPEPDDPDAYSGARNAREWREACRANLARAAARPKVKQGDTIRVATPWTFADDVERDTFTLVDGKRNRWRGADGHMVRLPARGRWPEYEVLA